MFFFSAPLSLHRAPGPPSTETCLWTLWAPPTLKVLQVVFLRTFIFVSVFKLSFFKFFFVFQFLFVGLVMFQLFLDFMAYVCIFLYTYINMFYSSFFLCLRDLKILNPF